MAGYVKLFQSILDSTIWGEDHQTRIVWITLMAKADRHGVVEGSIPGIAHSARVSLDDCRAAMAKFEAPDPDSRTPDNEGRRIKRVEGGWQLLNHHIYREKMSQDQQRARKTKNQRAWRDRKRAAKKAKVRPKKGESKVSPNVDSSRPLSPYTDPDTDPHTDQDQNPLSHDDVRPAVAVAEVVEEFDQAWAAYPRKTGKGAARKAWQKAKPLLADVLKAIAWQRQTRQWTRQNGQFIPHMATWLNQSRWEDEPHDDGGGGNAATFDQVDDFIRRRK